MKIIKQTAMQMELEENRMGAYSFVSFNKKNGLININVRKIGVSKSAKLTKRISDVIEVKAKIRSIAIKDPLNNKKIILFFKNGEELTLNQISFDYNALLHFMITPNEVKVGKAIAEFLDVPFEQSFTSF